MVNVSLFFRTFTNFAVFVLIFLSGSLWAHYCFKKNKGQSLMPAVALSALLFVAWGMYAGVGVDEVEHLHCSWLMHAGCVPFRDFWQHHAPVLWILLAPLCGHVAASASIFSLSRIAFGLLFALIVFTGWKLARKVWGRQARLSLYLLICFACGILGQFLWVRPDPCATLFLLICIYFCLEIPGKRIAPSFFAGAAFGLAASFIFKQYLLFLVPLYVVLREKKGARAAKIAAYLLGVCCGIMPLAWYLVDKHIAGEFVTWVINYNRKRIIYSVDFPAVMAALGAWGAYQLWARYRTNGDTKAGILFIVFCAVSASSLTHALFPFFSYNIGLWYILCACVGCSMDLQELTSRLPSKWVRATAAGLFIALVISPQAVALSDYNKRICFSSDKKAIAQLVKYGSSDCALALIPYHPVFAFDATRLYSYWQLRLANDYPELQKDMTAGGMAGEIRRRRPAVVLCIQDKKDFLLELSQKQLISKNEYNDLMDFFKAGYTIEMIGGNGYFVRNDRVKAGAQ